MCQLCKERRLHHAETCPRYLDCGKCNCAPVRCWSCNERWERVKSWAAVLLGVALAGLILWGMTR